MNTVVSQALATGLPVVATSHSGLPEQVLDGKNGYVVPEADPTALAATLLRLFSQPEVWPEMGRRGRAHAADHYDSSRLIEAQIADYRRLKAGSLPAKQET